MVLKKTLLAGVFAAFATTAAYADAPLIVENGNDSGEGSLRAALEMASKSIGPSQIIIETQSDIMTKSPLVYSGMLPLDIIGMGQTVKTNENITLLTASMGADLSISDLNFSGPGGFSIQNRGDQNGQQPGKGIFVDLRDDQSGTAQLILHKVTVADVAYHGIHVSDCNLADACGSGGGGAGKGSAASISITLDEVTINNVGNGMFDADGLRVDERGEGSITLVSTKSTFNLVGADGVELDEGQAGDVTATAIENNFTNNGGYCDKATLSPFMPKVDEAEFVDNVRAEADIPGVISGTADDRCFEREVDLYASGFVKEYEFGIDFDDGFDIDEAGPGNLSVTMIDSIISGNLDEGADMDEEDSGNLFAKYIRSRATNNVDDGYKMSEEGEGNVSGLVINSIAMQNGGKGVVYEEEDGGNVLVTVRDTRTAQNDNGDKTGLEIVQDGKGTGQLIIGSSTIDDGIDADGVEIIETAATFF